MNQNNIWHTVLCDAKLLPTDTNFYRNSRADIEKREECNLTCGKEHIENKKLLTFQIVSIYTRVRTVCFGGVGGSTYLTLPPPGPNMNNCTLKAGRQQWQIRNNNVKLLSCPVIDYWLAIDCVLKVMQRAVCCLFKQSPAWQKQIQRQVECYKFGLHKKCPKYQETNSYINMSQYSL